MNDGSTVSSTFLANLSRWILLAVIAAVRLLVFPFFTNFMITSKILILFLGAGALLSLFVWDVLTKRGFEVPKSPLMMPLTVFGLSTLFATFFSSRYPVENVLGMGGVLISFVLIALLGSILSKRVKADTFIQVLTAVGSLVAITTILQSVGFGPTRILNVMFGLDLPHTTLFNITGSPFIAVQLLAVLVVTHVVAFMTTRKLSTFQLMNLPFLLIGLVMNLLLVLPGKEAAPLILPFGVSWSIATDVLKTPRSALIGVGPENFTSAYAIFRPQWTNTTTWWNTPFGQGSDLPLTLLATGGLLSFISWLWFAITGVNTSRAHFKKEPALVALFMSTLALNFAFPGNPILLAIQAVTTAFLIANTHQNSTKFHLLRPAATDAEGDSNRQSLVFASLPLVVAAAVAIGLTYGIGRAYAASYTFFRSSYALQQNDAAQVYELQRQATELNPYDGLYRSNYGMTNFAIATALANKTDATEQEKQQISQLIQQALREAKAATLLRPEDSQGWRVLAQIYRNLIGTAEGADQWAVSSYVTAIQTNPTDPTLRVELGGLFLSAGQYDQAISLFQQATQLKPDYANAYYNLANALKMAKQYEAAKTVYQQTLALIPADSEDYTKTNLELEALQKEMDSQAATDTDSEGAAPNQASTNSTSLLNQNLNQPESEVVTPPATSPLGAEELNTTTLPSPQPSASPVVTPAPSPTPTP